MAKKLIFDHRLGSAELSVSRSEEVPDLLWQKVRTEWGGSGRSPKSTVQVPINVFMNRMSWVPGYCRKFGVTAEWLGDSQDLVRRQVKDKQSLENALEAMPTLDLQVVQQGLEGSRLGRSLRDFQLRDLAKLLALAHGANFSVPGAGKTAVAMATYEWERCRGRVEQMLVVAPVSAFESWEEEASLCLSPSPRMIRFNGEAIPRAEVLLVNYQRLDSGFQLLSNWIAKRPTYVVLDEAHRMKRGWSGEWGRNSLNLAYLAERRDILTGTPAPQATADLEALFDFVWPGHGRKLIPRASGHDVRPGTVAERIAPLFVRTNKSELELPEPSIRIVEEPLGPLHQEIYDAIRGSLNATFSSLRARSDLRAFARVVMYMLEAATNPALLVAGASPHDPVMFRHPPLEIPHDSSIDELLRAYADHETPWKFRYLRQEILNNVGRGRKTLVWSNFVRNLQTLFLHELSDLGPAIVHGGITDRDDQIGRFRADENCHVLLANPAAMAEGISLHHVCHDAIYLDRTFNAGHYLQSVDRIHRLGLKPSDKIRVKVLSSLATIDTLVNSRIRNKAERLAILMRDPGLPVMSLPATAEEGLEGEPDLGFDEADLTRVLSHLRE